MAIIMIAKFFSDMFLGIVPAIIPTLRDNFGLTLQLCIILTTCLHISANLIQLFVGHLRPNKSKPLVILISSATIAAIALVGLLPASASAFPLIALLIIITGCANGMYNPEALRIIHRLKRIRSAMGSSLFAASALCGYAIGSWLGPALTWPFGLKGLLLTLPVPVVITIMLLKARLKLHTEKPDDRWSPVRREPVYRLPLWPIMLMAIMAALSSHIMGWLLPTYLTDIKLGQVFGGFSITLWCIGSAFGTFFWAYVSKYKGDLCAAVIAFLSGIPFIILYLLNIESKAAIGLLFIAGFGSPAVFALTISMARNASGSNLGRRMGLIIGGVWGIAALAMPPISELQKHIGTQPILCFVPVGYTLAAIIGIILMIKTRKMNSGKT